MGQRFPRSLRLRRTADFRAVQPTGRRFRSRNLILVVSPNGLDHPRFGVAVGKKVGHAVSRNRVKRWLREAFRRQRCGLTGVDLVLIARPCAATAGYHLLYRELGRLLGGARGVTCPAS